jgi:hypothetical protein
MDNGALPPGADPIHEESRMPTATARVIRFTSAVALCILAGIAAPGAAHAQILRGVTRSLDSARTIERAQVFALNLAGKSIGNTITDGNGRFLLKVDARGAPFVVSVRRIGLEPTSSQPIVLTNTDTLELELLVTEKGIFTDTVKVTAPPTFNEIKLAEAKRRGWKVFPPAEVAARRETVNEFGDLIRGLGYPGLMVPTRRDDCIRSTRFNRCLMIVMDGTPIASGNPMINPRDVYFIAVLNASDAVLQFGDRAPYGAILVYTRMRGDKVDK